MTVNIEYLRVLRKELTIIRDSLALAQGFLREIQWEYDRKYNPAQPRVPSGNSEGGQWTDGGGGGARGPLWHEATTRKPPGRQRPEDLLEGGAGRGGGGYGSPRSWRDVFRSPATPQVNRAAEKIRALNRQSADDLHETLAYRAYGRRSPKETDARIREAADDIEKFLGGKVRSEDLKPSKSGDLVILKMDVRNPGKMKDRKTPDDPHFHFEKLDKDGNWIDASEVHKNYFKKD